mmetsp:Transcript_69399/g.125141  ORF Transcript_69399/g.125141 Transcript_69399/m.125141 type:complete len:258 (+) Transcript_69399:671-1444(+)
MIARVANQNAAIFSQSDALGELKLPFACADVSDRAKVFQLLGPWVELQHLKSVVQEVRHHDTVLTVCQNATGRIKVIHPKTFLTEGCQRLLRMRVEDLNPMVALVDYENVPSRVIEGDATRVVHGPNLVRNVRLSSLAQLRLSLTFLLRAKETIDGGRAHVKRKGPSLHFLLSSSWSDGDTKAVLARGKWQEGNLVPPIFQVFHRKVLKVLRVRERGLHSVTTLGSPFTLAVAREDVQVGGVVHLQNAQSRTLGVAL